MKTKIFKLLISVILLMASLQPVVYAPYDTASPSESSDDAMMTIAGNYFGDTHYLALKDENVDVVTGVRFNGVGVPQGAKINNATLFVYNVYDHGEGLGTCTLYGDDADHSLAFNDSSSFTRVFTNALVNWNISDIRDRGTYNLSVTEIVQEIIDRPGWSSGNSLSLILQSARGSPRREFASEDSFYTHPYIAIWYDEELTEQEIIDEIQDQAEDPYNDTSTWTWEYNDTYRGIDIYIASELSAWLNFSTFTQFGAQDKMTGENATFFQLTNFYQDSDDYYRRNFSDDGSGIVHVKFGITFESLPWTGATNGYSGAYGISDVHSYGENWGSGYRYTVRTRTADTSGNIRTMPLDSSVWYNIFPESGLPFTFYYDIHINMNTKNVITYIYNDIEMTSLNHSITDLVSSGPNYSPGLFQYEYIFFRNYLSADSTGFTAKFHSKEETDLDSVIFLVYPNGTLVDDDPLPEDVDPHDVIDDLLGGAQPEDPETENYGAIGKFQWKLLVMAVGFIMLLGSPIAGIHLGASTATWIKLVFVMCFGLAILSQLKFM